MKNKAQLKDGLKSGTYNFQAGRAYFEPPKNPLMFANSDACKKLQNRNRKNKRK